MKKVLLLAIIFFIVALGIVYLNVLVFTSEESHTADVIEDMKKQLATDPQADPDNDGLLNWEEELYGTSKQHADSDGDGIDDKTEIDRGSDPTDILTLATGTVETRLSEPVSTYSFQQTSNPLSLEEIGNQIYGGGGSGNLDLDTLTKEQLEYKGCVNRMATWLGNSIVFTLGDTNSLGQYVIGSSTDTFAAEKLRTAYIQAEEDVQEFDNVACSDLNIHVRNLQENYFSMRSLLDSALLASTTNVQDKYPIWQEYTLETYEWVKSLNKIVEEVSSSNVPFTANEPGNIFTANPALLQ